MAAAVTHVPAGWEDTLHRLTRQVERLVEEVTTLKKEPIEEPRRVEQPSNSAHRNHDIVCWHCNERGHVKRNCPEIGNASFKLERVGGTGLPPTSHVKTERQQAMVGSIKTSSATWMTGQIEGREMFMLLDTGSAVMLLSAHVWEAIKPAGDSKLHGASHGVVTADGSALTLVE